MPYKDPLKRNELVRLWREKNRGYSKEYQSSHPEQRRMYEKKNRHKINARQKVLRALKSGRLSKGSVCSDCDNCDVEAHHNDYTKPFEVEWLCRKHHEDRHRLH